MKIIKLKPVDSEHNRMVSYDTVECGVVNEMGCAEPDVNKVLADMRAAIQLGRIDVVDRGSYLNTKALLGILDSEVFDVLTNLTHQNYVKGPEIDDDYPTSDKFWVFKSLLLGTVIYIKFKVLYQLDGSVKVVSFHIDNFRHTSR